MAGIFATIRKRNLPDQSLLKTYRDQDGCYTDCYETEIEGSVRLSQFVSTFYCTPLFKLERLILKLAVNRPSTDLQAHQLGVGGVDRFAAWTVEKRNRNQLLMCDMTGRTRSWFMVEPFAAGSRTRLYFGSAVVPKNSGKNRHPSPGFPFSLLLGFHKLYSRALLWSAEIRL